MGDKNDGSRRENFAENKNMAMPSKQWKQNTKNMSHGKLAPVLAEAAKKHLMAKAKGITTADAAKQPPHVTDRKKISPYKPQKVVKSPQGTGKTSTDSNPKGFREPLRPKAANKVGINYGRK